MYEQARIGNAVQEGGRLRDLARVLSMSPASTQLHINSSTRVNFRAGVEEGRLSCWLAICQRHTHAAWPSTRFIHVAAVSCKSGEALVAARAMTLEHQHAAISDFDFCSAGRTECSTWALPVRAIELVEDTESGGVLDYYMYSKPGQIWYRQSGHSGTGTCSMLRVCGCIAVSDRKVRRRVTARSPAL